MTEINISKIKVDDTNLIIKDSQARNNIDSLSTNINNELNSLSTNINNNVLNELNSLSTNINNQLNSLSTNINNEFNSLSTNINNELSSLSTNINNNLNSLSTDINNLYNINANKFSTTTSYSTNDFVLYDGQLYKFTSDHNIGAWNNNEVENVNITNELKTRIIPIEQGGTSASTIIEARKNLGYLGMFFSETVNSSECIEIPANADLNNPIYTATGKYVCSMNTTVGTLSNKPSINMAFQMLVFNLLGSDGRNFSEVTDWNSRTRILMTYTGEIYINNMTRNQNGSITTGTWKKIQTS